MVVADIPVRYVIVDEALLATKAPVTSRAVVEAYGKVEERVDVALKKEDSTFPVMFAEPATERVLNGDVVPMPRRPR